MSGKYLLDTNALIYAINRKLKLHTHGQVQFSLPRKLIFSHGKTRK